MIITLKKKVDKIKENFETKQKKNKQFALEDKETRAIIYWEFVNYAYIY